MKLEELREKWEKRYDAYLVWKPEFVGISDIRYLTGFSGSTGIFLQTKGKSYLIVDFRYREQSRRETRGVEIVDIPYGKTQFEVLTDILRHEGVKKIAVEEYVPFGYVKTLKKHIKGIRLFSVSGLVSSLRARKTNEEIEKIKKAQEITDRLFDWILNNLKPGKQSEREVAIEMERWVKENGADGMSFDPIVAGNERSSMPHARVTENPIPEKGVLLIDFGVRYMGYCSDMTRTIWIGSKVDDEFEKAYRIVLEAQSRAIDALRFKGSRKAADIDRIARDIIESSDFKGTFGHGLGHGVGLDIHEAPYLSPRSKDVLKGNEVVTVEPGIYLEGKFGVRIEDIVVAGRGEVITRSKKELTRL